MKKKGKVIIFLIYLLLALYFINYSVQFVKIPEQVSEFNPWIIFIGGILIFIRGLQFLLKKKKKSILSPSLLH